MKLVKPDLTHMIMAESFAAEFPETEYPNCYIRELDVYLKTKTYEEWLKYLDQNRKRFHITDYFVIHNEKIVGMVEIRYHISKALINEFGNIGYVLSPKMRKLHLAVPMLKLSLKLCKRMGFQHVIITCQNDNIASYKTIERCGGKLSSVFDSKIYGEKYRRYICATE